MTSQQAAIAETVRALKLALRRQRANSPPPSLDSSEDDADGLHTHSNRGNKIRPSAQYAHEGRLDTTGGQARYKRKISHAGYERCIIKKRPRLYDEDGDVVVPLDVPSDVEDGHMGLYGEAIEEDPFGGVRLEQLMKPLTSAAELPEHPSLRLAYTSGALTEMAREAAETVRGEKAALWKAKRLLERFRGDGGFMACERFETGGDDMLLRERGEGSGVLSVGETEGLGVGEGAAGAEVEQYGDAMEGVEALDHVESALAPNRVEVTAPPAITAEARPSIEDAQQEPTNGTNDAADASPPPAPQRSDQDPAPHPAVIDLARPSEEDSSNSGTNPSAPSHRMTTRARARSPQLPASPSPSPSDSASIPSIHPWFAVQPTTLPDRDLGLPPPEADQTRQLLLLYCQKQENIVRQLTTLYDGLQRTDRLRREVYRSCRAEAHVVSDGRGGVVTEMSDGEDWFDVRELGAGEWLLEKGKEEVDDGAEEEGRRVGGRRRRVVGR